MVMQKLSRMKRKDCNDVNITTKFSKLRNVVEKYGVVVRK